MQRFELLRWRSLMAYLLLACALSAPSKSADHPDYSKMPVSQLIDELMQIDGQTPGVNSAAVYDGFIGGDKPSSFTMGVLGVAPPIVPPQMHELVRRGPLALPELIKHLDDKRPTRLEVGNKLPRSEHPQVGVDFFMFSYFSDEYDPRLRDFEAKSRPEPMQKNFTGRYTVKVADVCFMLIGQIVSRHFVAVRYQPSAGLVVNSPIEAPALAEKIRSDWGNADAEAVKASLLRDIRSVDPANDKSVYVLFVANAAMERLRLYFPDTYNTLQGDDLKKRREFEKEEEKRQSLKN
ncbi:MAG TPA: hypothetical protein VIB39_08340 [Candidatus Angelobacter sp.]|jgi:hypothetical protein